MSWQYALYRTYENSLDEVGQIIDKKRPLLPLYHTTAVFDTEIIIDENGALKNIRKLDTKENTILPCTVLSANARVGSSARPHGLNDNTQYIARDYSSYIPSKAENYRMYFEQLKDWVSSPYSHYMVEAVYSYISNNDIITDLANADLISMDNVDSLLSELEGNEKHDKKIYAVIKKEINKTIRFVVYSDDELESKSWRNKDLWQCWIEYQQSLQCDTERNICYIEGIPMIMASFHAKKIRHTGDGAKIVSSNDDKNFTFRGSIFKDASQACEIGEEVSQKMHNALIWLISKQGKHFGDKVLLSWSVDGLDIPYLTEDTLSLLDNDSMLDDEFDAVYNMSEYDTRQKFADAFNSYINGYKQKFDDTSDIYVIILDSATPGRLAVMFNRHLKGSEFLDRLDKWHSTGIWRHAYRKRKAKSEIAPFYGVPSVYDIVESMYGKNAGTKLTSSAIERLIPCIIDERKLPLDVFQSIFNRTKKRNVLSNYEFNKLLTIACSIYSKQNESEGYTVALQRERKSRDYLYGRLLSIADDLERWALSSADEKRPTNAQRLMQRFADRPFSTYRSIEMALAPCKQRLGGKASKYYKEIECIMDLFEADEFADDSPLSGEFLIGYYCQHSYFINKNIENSKNNEEE